LNYHFIKHDVLTNRYKKQATRKRLSYSPVNVKDLRIDQIRCRASDCEETGKKKDKSRTAKSV
jgi:hypothetical protein